jgi:hypothetical protein
MTEPDVGWRADLERWLAPFLARLSHPVCVAGKPEPPARDVEVIRCAELIVQPDAVQVPSGAG